jgi:D-threo-aldose 1-dehydrogenase
VGCSPLAGVPQNFGYDVGLEQALATLRRVFAGPFNFLDTANSYGEGESERRIGMVLAELGGLPEGFVLASKVDPDPASGAFDGDRARRSFAETLSRLGVERLQLLYLHDPEVMSFEEAMRPGGAVKALVALRDEGAVSYIGVAGGPVGLLAQFVDTGAFDVVLTHNRYTLLDRSAGDLLAKAAEKSMGVVNAAVFGGGVLAKGVDQLPKYAYHEMTRESVQRVREMEALCFEHGVPLKAAALQFSVRDPRVSSTAVGFSRPKRVDEISELVVVPIPDVVWKRLEELALPPEQWLY